MSEGRVGLAIGQPEIGRGWRLFFWAAALFNFAIGLSGMLAPVPTVDDRIIGLLIFSFGIVYAVVARDPLRYGSVLWAGLVGKLGVVSLLGIDAVSLEGSSLALVIIACDAVFALGFLWFLLTKRDAAT